jgi:hypothetical protein
MRSSGLPKKKSQVLGKGKDPKSYLYYAQRRKEHLERGLTLPKCAPRTNLVARTVRDKWLK